MCDEVLKPLPVLQKIFAISSISWRIPECDDSFVPKSENSMTEMISLYPYLEKKSQHGNEDRNYDK